MRAGAWSSNRDIRAARINWERARRVADAVELMKRRKISELPVVDGERWVGMLSMRDLMRVELSEQGDEIKLLHEYIQH